MNEEGTANPLDAFKDAAGIFLGWSIVMIVLGFVALLLSFPAGVRVSIVVSWIIAFGGVAYLVYAFAARGTEAFLSRVLIGAIHVLGGGYLAFHAELALASLTLVVAGFFP